ncbi:MAG: outer membrane beta-barrel protein [Myxococcales bacterium]
MKEELLVDSYYMYNFKADPSNTPPGGRVYDTQSNSFTLNYAKVGLEVDADPVTVRADIGFGQLAALLGGAAGPYSTAIQQAYASLKIPGTQLTLDMGRFNTTAGAEVIEANRNWLYSRSMLFYIIPVHHTGLRASYKINDMVGVQATLANGIFADMPDNNTPKTVGLSVSVAPLPTTAFVLTGYLGKEGATGTTSDPQHLTIDFVASHNVSDQFGLNLNIDYVKGKTATMTPGDSSSYAFGASLMARYVLDEHVNVAARGEFIKDKGIFLDPDGQEYEGTAMIGFPFAGHLEIRAELRGDFAKNAIFMKNANPADASKSQFTGTLAFLGFI